MSVWQFSANKNDIRTITSFPPGESMFYPLGRAKMKVFPEVGDIVIITADSRIFVMGTIAAKTHVGFLVIYDEVFKEGISNLRGQRRNWTKLKEMPI